jgi:hypothetical protein
MFRISKAAMDTSLERIRAKIAELDAKFADLRIAEREIRALEANTQPTTFRLKMRIARSKCLPMPWTRAGVRLIPTGLCLQLNQSQPRLNGN